MWKVNGNVLTGFKKYQEALECYNNALDLDDNCELALKAKENILKLLKK